jgi:hypothetical protein
MPERVILPIHGADHCLGGPDPIPCLGIAVFRAWKYLQANQTTITSSHTALNWEWWQNGDPSVFEPRTPANGPDPVVGTDLMRYVRLKQPGRYIHTVQIQPNGTNRTYQLALNETPEDPFGDKESLFSGRYDSGGDGWLSFTIARMYPEVDIFDSPRSYWPNFGAGGYVGSYWTLRVSDGGANTSIRWARMEIHFEPATPPASIP